MTVELVAVPPRDAIAALFERGKRLDPSFAWEDVWQEIHASQFTVAKSAGFDILKEIHAGLLKALSEGTTFREFAKELTPFLQSKGWWGRQLVTDPETGDTVSAQLGSTRRLRTIFDVNMRVSYAAGHWAGFERNKAARPFLRYVCILDSRTRPAHRARHNLVLPVDHPYWAIWAPPCGWNCRCTLQSLSQRDVDRLIAQGEQLFFEPPADVWRDYVNKRTGEIARVPEGIDPGWAYNPGKAGYQALPATAKLIDAPPALAAEVNADPDWLLKPATAEFANWFDLAAVGGRVEQSIVAVGALGRAVLDALRRRSIKPVSGAITIQQKAVQHMLRDVKATRGRVVPVDVLRRMPTLLASPRAVLLDKRDNSLLYIFDVPGDDRFGKIAVQVDFARRMRGPDGKAGTVTTNAIRTAGMVDARTLSDRVTYELIEGSL